jgi:hypothetical protein
MAAVGALIVFSGLVVLSIVISQLHKFVPLLEKVGEKKVESTGMASTTSTPPTRPPDIKEQATLFQPILVSLGPSFLLSELYSKAQEHNIPHPHLSISAFRDAGVLVPLGDGIFSWDPYKLTAPSKKAE